MVYRCINASQKSTYLYSAAANPCDDRHLHRIDVLTFLGASSCQTSDNYSHLAIKTVHRCGMVVDPGTSMFIILKLNTYLPLPLSFPCAVSTESLVAVRLTWKLWRSFTSAGRCGIMDVAG
ncbi:conserved hypothetical protein [Trichinella spiralis]|uniref:hypothetical protein n=1 Tax=Trichinella spiralis TaxID=6334 RepID=UPI0001EFC701|nr:conserved hypothetical protein [Trichinella spiralis]